MAGRVVLIDGATGKALHNETYTHENTPEPMLLVTGRRDFYGIFKTIAYTAQGTTQQVTPKGAGSIELTDLIVTFEKKALAFVTINFHDTTNTAPIFKAALTDAPVNIAIPFAGRWQGWSEAHIDVIVSGADAIGNVSIGFMHSPASESLSYNAWNVRR